MPDATSTTINTKANIRWHLKMLPLPSESRKEEMSQNLLTPGVRVNAQFWVATSFVLFITNYLFFLPGTTKKKQCLTTKSTGQDLIKKNLKIINQKNLKEKKKFYLQCEWAPWEAAGNGWSSCIPLQSHGRPELSPWSQGQPPPLEEFGKWTNELELSSSVSQLSKWIKKNIFFLRPAL